MNVKTFYNKFSFFLFGIFGYGLTMVAQPKYDKKQLEACMAFNKEMKTDRLVIAIQDTIIINATFRGKPEALFPLYSITKVFSGIAVGLMIEKKLLSDVEVPVATFFQEWKTDSLKRKITLRHLLQHTSGIAAQTGSQDIYSQPDFIQYALNSEAVTPAGHTYFYNNKAFNIISGVVKKITQQSLEAFIQKELFSPLGITNYKWNKDSQGNTWGMDGLWMSATDLLKVGQLLSNYGKWEGKQLLPVSWCTMMFQLPLPNVRNGIYGYGMAIKSLPFQEQICLDSATISQLKKEGLPLPLIEKLQNMQLQQPYYTYKEFGTQLSAIFTIEETEAITTIAFRNLIPIYTEKNQQVYIKHGGEYGLLLAAYPKKNKVMVRFLGEHWGRKQHKDGKGYQYFADDELIQYLLLL